MGKRSDRQFTTETKNACWNKAEKLPGRDETRWRKDAAGNVVCAHFKGCSGCLCYEYDHIVPYSKGGKSTVDNCQILQTKVNRSKSNKEGVRESELKGFSYNTKFTDKELDVIEMAVYGNVNRTDNKCRCKTVNEMFGKMKLKGPDVADCQLPYEHSS